MSSRDPHYTLPMPQMPQYLSLTHWDRPQNHLSIKIKTSFSPFFSLPLPLYTLLLLSLKPTHQNHNILLTGCIVLPPLALKWGFPFTVIHLFVYVCRLHWVAFLITCVAFCRIVNPKASEEEGGGGSHLENNHIKIIFKMIMVIWNCYDCR